MAASGADTVIVPILLDPCSVAHDFCFHDFGAFELACEAAIAHHDDPGGATTRASVSKWSDQPLVWNSVPQANLTFDSSAPMNWRLNGVTGAAPATISPTDRTYFSRSTKIALRRSA